MYIASYFNYFRVDHLIIMTIFITKIIISNPWSQFGFCCFLWCTITASSRFCSKYASQWWTHHSHPPTYIGLHTSMHTYTQAAMHTCTHPHTKACKHECMPVTHTQRQVLQGTDPSSFRASHVSLSLATSEVSCCFVMLQTLMWQSFCT